MASLVAQFNTSIRTGVAPLTVNFTNISTGPYTSVRWDFGDGSQSSQINPSHQFINDGVFQTTLTIYDDQSGSSQTNTSISIFADDDYSTSATTQQALFTSKRFTAGQVSVKKTKVSGTEIHTSIYFRFPFTNTGYISYHSTNAFQLAIVANSLSGGTTLKYRHDLYFGRYGDGGQFNALISAYGNTYFDGFITLVPEIYNNQPNQTLDVDEIFTGGTNNRPILHYKIVSIDSATTTITVDRPLPNIAGNFDDTIASGICPSMAWLRKTDGTDHTFDYPITNVTNIGFSQMNIDSLNTLNADTLAYFSGNSSKGQQQYFGENNSNGSAFSINWLNASDYNVDSFEPGSVLIQYPFIMWHDQQFGGVSLYDSVDSTEIDEITGLPFRKLRLGLTTEDTIVGKIFHTKGVFILTDQELLATTQFNSNRSWSMVEPNISTNSTTNGISDSGVTYYITYRLRDDETVASGGTSFGTGNVGLDPLHCRYVKTATTTNNTTQFIISADKSNWYTEDTTNLSGFSVGNVDVIVGTGLTTTNYPDVDSFKYSAVTTTYTDLQSGIIIPNYSDMTTPYTLGYISGNTNMGFGFEDFGLYYMSALTTTNIYKMSTTCVAKNNEFNTTQNKSFDEALNESVYITEVALYNEQNELLMTGKLNNPIEKNDKKFVTIKMELDL